MPARKKQAEGPPVILLVTNAAWRGIRTQFSEIEKETLRRAVVNQVLCPPGVYLDCAKLPAGLSEKLRGALVARAEKNLAADDRPEREAKGRKLKNPAL